MPESHPLMFDETDQQVDSLNEEERERYARQCGYPGWGEEGQLRLRRASVLLLGCGGLGSPVALYLAAAGVGRLGFVDPDRVELSNLQRQIAHTTASLGEWKTTSAAARVRALNPHVTVEERRAPVSEDESWVRSFDAMIDATDRYATRLAHNRLAFKLGLPFVTGAVAGLAGQVFAFDARSGGPCYQCVVATDPDAGRQTAAPPAVVGAAAGAIGSLMAAEALKRIVEVGAPLSGHMIHLDLADCRCSTVRLAAREECPVCGSHRVETVG